MVGALRLPRASLLCVPGLVAAEIDGWQPWCPSVWWVVATLAADAAAVALTSSAEARGIGKKIVVVVIRTSSIVGSVLFNKRNGFVAARSEGRGHRAALVFLRVHKKRVAGIEWSEVVQVARFLCMLLV